MGADRTGMDSELGLAYLVVDTNNQSVMKELEQKIPHQMRQLTVIFSEQQNHFIAHNVQQWAARYCPKSSILIENWYR